MRAKRHRPRRSLEAIFIVGGTDASILLVPLQVATAKGDRGGPTALRAFCVLCRDSRPCSRRVHRVVDNTPAGYQRYRDS